MKELLQTLAILTMVLSTACATATIRPNGGAIKSNAADFEETHDFFIFGLAGEGNIDVEKVCEGKDAEQLQTQFAVKDVVLTVVTFGLYTPKTARVWCE